MVEPHEILNDSLHNTSLTQNIADLRGVLKIPPPILNRSLTDLSNAIVDIYRVRKIREAPVESEGTGDWSPKGLQRSRDL